MPSVLAYHRPESLEAAAALLAGPNRRAIGGGTIVVPQARIQSDQGIELVDLQGLGLDGVDVISDTVVVGAMVRLGDLVANADVPDLLRVLATRELPSALRNQATVGGTVANAGGDSVLLAGMLVYDADVAIHGADPIPLATLLKEGVGDNVITGVVLARGGTGAIEATGRTPADDPIVAAVARSGADSLRLALTGVADTPVLVDPANPIADLDPIGDFRGSREYRIHLAEVLAARVLEEVR